MSIKDKDLNGANCRSSITNYEEEFQLCKECPAPQNKNGVSNYKITCEKHQKKK